MRNDRYHYYYDIIEILIIFNNNIFMHSRYLLHSPISLNIPSVGFYEFVVGSKNVHTIIKCYVAFHSDYKHTFLLLFFLLQLLY